MLTACLQTLIVIWIGVVVTPLVRAQKPVGVHEAGSAEAAATAAGKQATVASAVRISTPDGRLLGCGVIVSQGEREFDVLTADHIVRDAAQWIIQCHSPGKNGQLGQVFQHRNVQVVAQDARADLARLRVKSGIPVAGVITLTTPEQGRQLDELTSQKRLSAWVVEWTTADQLKTRQVHVLRRHLARRTPQAEPVSFWELSEPSVSGMSGGALVSDNGLLLGIASGNSGQHAFYTDEREIAQFMAK